jgi:photosystem II stability/assembly factor-like uncharacterized protein
MKFLAPVVILPLMLAVSAWAQEQPPAAPAASPAAPSLPAMPVLENNGKPMVLPFHCTDDDIQWAGLTCSEDDPCPIYLELAAVASQGGRIVTAGNIHSAAVTLYTVVLASEDAGQTWTEAHERIRGAGLDHIQFLDGQTAWVSGLTLFPLPEDPFLLLTTDAGKTWRQRLIAGENHPGAISQFYFSSRANGLLLIDRGPAETGDRYERFGSSDGGESWTIQEESTKPLKMRQTEAPSTDWRLRVDSATQSYHLERRQGERWTGVAAFAVKIGACKPEQ